MRRVPYTGGGLSHLNFEFYINIQVVSLAFSHDSKYLLAQGGSPDHQLVYFFWEKGKVGRKIQMVQYSNR